MHMHVPDLAAALDADRVRDARQRALADRFRRDRPMRSGLMRRTTARALAWISLASAAGVRRIDACLAEDLRRSVSGALVDGA